MFTALCKIYASDKWETVLWLANCCNSEYEWDRYESSILVLLGFFLDGNRWVYNIPKCKSIMVKTSIAVSCHPDGEDDNDNSDSTLSQLEDAQKDEGYTSDDYRLLDDAYVDFEKWAQSRRSIPPEEYVQDVDGDDGNGPETYCPDESVPEREREAHRVLHYYEKRLFLQVFQHLSYIQHYLICLCC